MKKMQFTPSRLQSPTQWCLLPNTNSTNTTEILKLFWTRKADEFIIEPYSFQYYLEIFVLVSGADSISTAKIIATEKQQTRRSQMAHML